MKSRYKYQNLCLTEEEKRIILNELECHEYFLINQYFKEQGNSSQTKDFCKYYDKIKQTENEKGNQMLIIVFRFFIQSGELDFFIKRLKGIVTTKKAIESSQLLVKSFQYNQLNKNKISKS